MQVESTILVTNNGTIMVNPCLKCGKAGVNFKDSGYSSFNVSSVECKHCGYEVDTYGVSGKEEQLKIWNGKREELEEERAQLQARVEELEEILEGQETKSRKGRDFSIYNLNDKMSVDLTDFGKQILENHIDNFPPATYFDYEGDRLTTTVWEIMQIFGNFLTHGGQLPFKTAFKLERRTSAPEKEKESLPSELKSAIINFLKLVQNTRPDPGLQVYDHNNQLLHSVSADEMRRISEFLKNAINK